MKMEQTGCSEKSVYKIQMPGNYPEESIQYSDAGELPRRKHTTFRCRGITQKKAYNIQMPGNYPEESIQHSE
jgi:hypothetical protein